MSVVILAYPDGHLETYRGELHGTLLEGPRGANGFGYDPLFMPESARGRTMAQLTPDEKHALSHRGNAFRALAEALADIVAVLTYGANKYAPDNWRKVENAPSVSRYR